METTVEKAGGITQFGPVIWRRIIVVTALAVVGLAACSKQASLPAAATPVAQEGPTEAQPRLPTIQLWLGPAELTAEVALRPREIQTGMMFRTNLPPDEGMLFVFATPHRAAFWMKNTGLPLSAAYIDPEGTILEIRELVPHDTNNVVASTDRVQFVLETSRGWFERHQITPGTAVRTERGTLLETFFRGRRP